MGRATFWWGFAVWLLIVFAINWQLPDIDYFTLMGGAMERFPGNVFETWWSLLADLVLFGALASWMVQRMHDRGRAGYWWPLARAVGWSASIAAIYLLVEGQTVQAITQSVMSGEQTPPEEQWLAILWGFDELWARNPAAILSFGVGLITLILELVGFILALWPSEPRTNTYGPPPGQGSQAEAFA
jgi:uncharacterized membrane protein YhaH (DUF805 family)